MKKLYLIAAALANVAYADLPQGNTISSSGGRYAMGQLSGARLDQFMLDTATGRIWQVTCMKPGIDGVCNHLALQQVVYLDANANETAFPPEVPKGYVKKSTTQEFEELARSTNSPKKSNLNNTVDIKKAIQSVETKN